MAAPINLEELIQSGYSCDEPILIYTKFYLVDKIAKIDWRESPLLKKLGIDPNNPKLPKVLTLKVE
jgi:hypothetical protein